MNKKNIAVENDHRLRELAQYSVSKGNTINIESPQQIWDRFTEFKMRVRLGSFSIEQLEDRVYGEHGITTALPGNPLAQWLNDLGVLSETEMKNKEIQKKNNEKK